MKGLLSVPFETFIIGSLLSYIWVFTFRAFPTNVKWFAPVFFLLFFSIFIISEEESSLFDKIKKFGFICLCLLPALLICRFG